MRGPYDYAKQLLDGEISWSEIPPHLRPQIKEIYLALKAEIDPDDATADLQISDQAIIGSATPRWDRQDG